MSQLVKVRFQDPVLSTKYNSTYNAITTIVREERFIGLFKGITSPLVRFDHRNVVRLISAHIGICCSHERARIRIIPLLHEIATRERQLGPHYHPGRFSRCRKWDRLFVRTAFLSRMVLEQFNRIVTTPTDLIKIRQQSLLVRSSARKVALQIFREHGIKGLYRGIAVTALRDCGYGAYFATVLVLFSQSLMIGSDRLPAV